MNNINQISFSAGSEAKITEDGFAWKTISYDQARAIFDTGVISLYALFEDGSESEIETAEDIRNAEIWGMGIGIEVGHLHINEQ